MQIEVWQSPPRIGDQKWHWHFRSKGRIVSDAESFPTKGNAVRAAKSVVRGVLKRLNTSAFHPDPPRLESSVVGDLTIIKWY